MDPSGFADGLAGYNLFLAGDEVQVWSINLDSLPEDLAKFNDVLSLEELVRAERFHFSMDQRRSVVSRGFLRILLGAILGLPAKSLQFEYTEFGKPQLISGRGRSLQFNVSHSGVMILVAIAWGRAVGVDVERIRADLDLDGVASRFFSKNEYRQLSSLVGPSKYTAFFTCWTRKEAYLKGEGGGLSVPLDQFDVSLLPGEDPRILENRHRPNETRIWALSDLHVPPDYIAALAVEGSGWTLRCLDATAVA